MFLPAIARTYGNGMVVLAFLALVSVAPAADPGPAAKSGQLSDELRQGKDYPADAPRSFAAFQREADAFAARWDPNARLGEASLTGTSSGGRFRLQTGRFQYYSSGQGGPAPAAGSMLTVLIDGLRITADDSPLMTTEAASPPPTTPDDLLPPEEILPKFWVLNDSAPPEQIFLLLFPSGPPRNQWLWRMAALRAPAVASANPASLPPALDMLYLDARSGKPVADSEGKLLAAVLPASEPTQVDPAIVGQWESSNPQGKWRMVFRVGSDGHYLLNVAADGSTGPPETGRLQASGGKWMETRNDGRVDQGTYRMPDAQTLILSTEQGQSLAWRRAMPATFDEKATPPAKVTSRPAPRR